jgi:FLVCR family MFS transporter 7
MAQTWFGVQERTFANLLATVSPSFGIIVSSAATSYIITEPSKVPLALLLWACWSVVPLVLVWFIPEKPPTPPSPSAAVMASNRTNSMEKWKKSFKTAFTNIDYITLWLLMSGQLSIFFIALVLVSSIMLPFGYTSNQIGWVFVVIIASGWTSLPISKIVDKYGTWVLALRLLLVFCTVGLLGLSLTLQLTSDNNWYWAIMLSAAVYGYAQFPTLSIVFELGEHKGTTPQVTESISNPVFLVKRWSVLFQICCQR